jgi:hypothetical protein
MPFGGRGERADDALRVLRLALGSSGPISYAGDHFRSPTSSSTRPGSAAHRCGWPAARCARWNRAIALADGWMPAFTLPPERVARMLRSFDRPDGFTVVQPVFPPLDPIADPDGARAALAARAEAGADVAVVTLAHTSLTHYLEQLDALRAAVRAFVGWAA